MKITKRQLKKIINETRRALADNPYAFEGDDVGPGEIPANYRSKLYSALAPLGFETGLNPESKYFKYDILDGLIIAEKQLAKAGFKDPSAIINFLKPRLADIFRDKRAAGGYRTQALVDAITYDVFSQAAGGAFAGDPTHSGPSFSRQPIWNEEEDPAPMISDSYNRKSKMKLSKRQLKRIIKEEYSKLKRQGLIRESYFKNMHIELQNELLAMAQERGGAITVNEAYQNDLVMEMDLDIDTTFQILMDMVDAGILMRTHDYQDQYNMGIEMVAFTVHPDYM